MGDSLKYVTSGRVTGMVAAAALGAFGASAVAPSVAQADEAAKPPPGWILGVDVRVRSETVEQSNFAEDALANTIRPRVSLQSPWFSNVRVFGEFEAVLAFGPEEFNNPAVGNPRFPVVADVESQEINQAYVEAKPFSGGYVKAGRFREVIGNQRFFGGVDWRQNNQTYDGAKATLTDFLPDTQFYYAYFGNVNRIFSEESLASVGGLQGDLESNIHLGEVIYGGAPFGTVRVYNYYTDVQANADVLSNNSFGINYSGNVPLGSGFSFKPYLEYAFQTDTADNPIDYQAHYYHIQPAVSYGGFKYGVVTLTPGFEVLGSDDGVRAFQTPFATLHKFNGFADQFLVTPNVGLQDLYVDATVKLRGFDGPAGGFLNGTLLKVAYHDFNTDEGNDDIASEFNAYVRMPLTPILKGLYVEAKYADFMDDEDTAVRGADVKKYIFGLGYKQSFDLTKILDDLK
ncbi:MAG: alginate export family protein [Pseudomonadota bacterium]